MKIDTNSRNMPVYDSIGGMMRHARKNVITNISVVVFSDLDGATLTVRFYDRLYRIKFADYHVLCQFIFSRRSWRGMNVTQYAYIWDDVSGFGYKPVVISHHTIVNGHMARMVAVACGEEDAKNPR